MTIRNLGRSIGATPTAPATPASSPAKTPAAGTPGTSAASRPSPALRSDSVQISDAARALASSEGPRAAASGLTTERVQQLRERVLQGAYNSTAVADQVARRILSSGDA